MGEGRGEGRQGEDGRGGKTHQRNTKDKKHHRGGMDRGQEILFVAIGRGAEGGWKTSSEPWCLIMKAFLMHFVFFNGRLAFGADVELLKVTMRGAVLYVPDNERNTYQKMGAAPAATVILSTRRGQGGGGMVAGSGRRRKSFFETFMSHDENPVRD